MGKYTGNDYARNWLLARIALVAVPIVLAVVVFRVDPRTIRITQPRGSMWLVVSFDGVTPEQIRARQEMNKMVQDSMAGLGEMMREQEARKTQAQRDRGWELAGQTPPAPAATRRRP